MLHDNGINIEVLRLGRGSMRSASSLWRDFAVFSSQAVEIALSSFADAAYKVSIAILVPFSGMVWCAWYGGAV